MSSFPGNMIRKLVTHCLRNIYGLMSTTLSLYRKWSKKKKFSFSEEITSMQILLFIKLVVFLDIFWTLELVLHGFLIKK